MSQFSVGARSLTKDFPERKRDALSRHQYFLELKHKFQYHRTFVLNFEHSNFDIVSDFGFRFSIFEFWYILQRS